MTRQFENEANPDIHSRTTAREILDDFAGERLDYWVTGYGTGGTLKGVGRVLAKERPDTKIIVCEPEDAQLLGSGVEQARNPDGTPAAPHPTFKPHPMQGWTPDFIPKLTDDAVAMKVIDRILPIPGPEAIRCSKDLAAKEGIFVGITAGATFAGALKIAAEAEKGANILCMLPDTGERYLSTPLFADVSADMNEEELRNLTLYAGFTTQPLSGRQSRDGMAVFASLSAAKGVSCAHDPARLPRSVPTNRIGRLRGSQDGFRLQRMVASEGETTRPRKHLEGRHHVQFRHSPCRTSK